MSKEVYFQYFKAFSVLTCVTYLFTMFGASTFIDAYSNIWLAKWSSESVVTNGSLPEEAHNTFYLSVYCGLGFGNGRSFIIDLQHCAPLAIFKAVSGVLLSLGAYRASTWFHDNLVTSLLRSPMSFFDRTPLGRIINRLSGVRRDGLRVQPPMMKHFAGYGPNR